MEQLPTPTASGASPTCWWMPAQDFTWSIPGPRNIIATPPAISFAVASAKFPGRVTVLYERGLDLYAVELRRDGELVERVDEVFFDTLGQTLERLIDDGTWRLIACSACPAASRSRTDPSSHAASRPRGGKPFFHSWRSLPCLFDSGPPICGPC